MEEYALSIHDGALGGSYYRVDTAEGIYEWLSGEVSDTTRLSLYRWMLAAGPGDEVCFGNGAIVALSGLREVINTEEK